MAGGSAVQWDFTHIVHCVHYACSILVTFVQLCFGPSFLTIIAKKILWSLEFNLKFLQEALKNIFPLAPQYPLTGPALDS